MLGFRMTAFNTTRTGFYYKLYIYVDYVAHVSTMFKYVDYVRTPFCRSYSVLHIVPMLVF